MAEKINCFIECLLPITVCNLKCHYCYVMQRDNRKMRPARLQYPVVTMAKSLRKERLGGTAYISICGAGETMMQRELPELVWRLLIIEEMKAQKADRETFASKNKDFKERFAEVLHNLA